MIAERSYSPFCISDYPCQSLVVDTIQINFKKQMTTTPRAHRPIRRTVVESHSKFYAAKPTITPAPTYQEAISRDLVIALEATERLNKSLDGLIEENGCSEFLASHRLLGEKITSNRNILLMLIGNAMDISIKADKPELKTKQPDYFTK